MSSTRAWSVDHFCPTIYTTTTASVQSMMWNLYNFFSDLSGTQPSLGYKIVAWNKGDATNWPGVAAGSTGNGRFDQPLPFANNSWFCVRFLSASKPFDMLFQCRVNSAEVFTAFGVSPGNPGVVEGLTRAAASDCIIAWSVGMNDNGTPCWNGSSGSNGADTKGATVWHKRLSNGMYLFPRNNNATGSGAWSATTSNMMFLNYPVAANSVIAPQRWHIYADKDTFMFINDVTDTTRCHRFNYFGPYTPLSSSNTTPTYMCISDNIPNTGQVYGYQASANPYEASIRYHNGGICHPSLSHCGSMGLVTSYNSSFVFPIFPSNIYGDVYGKIYNSNFAVSVNDIGVTGQQGWVGTTNPTNYFATIGQQNCDVSGSYTFFGATTVSMANKFAFPWPTTGSSPGTGVMPFIGTRYVEIIP